MPKKEKQKKNKDIKHTITEEDLEMNPELKDKVAVGEEITFPAEVEDIPVPEEAPIKPLEEPKLPKGKPAWAEQVFWDSLSEEQKAKIQYAKGNGKVLKEKG